MEATEEGQEDNQRKIPLRTDTPQCPQEPLPNVPSPRTDTVIVGLPLKEEKIIEKIEEPQASPTDTESDASDNSGAGFADTCGNCNKKFSEEESKIATIVDDEGRSISIHFALAYIFESYGDDNLNIESSVFVRKVPMDPDYSFCLQCSLTVSALYKAFRTFWKTCALESLVFKQLKIVQDNFRRGDEQEFPLPVKVEIEDDRSDDFIDDSFQNFLNDSEPSESSGDESDNSFDSGEGADVDCGEQKDEQGQPKWNLRQKVFPNYSKEFLEFPDDDELSQDGFFKFKRSQSEDEDFDPYDPSLREGHEYVRDIKIRKRKRAKKTMIGPAVDASAARSTVKHEVIEGSGSFACSYCPKMFSNEKSRNRHSKSHTPETGEPAFQCNICTKNFSRKEHLIRHSVRFHGESSGISNSFHCTFCSSKSFSRKEHLIRHQHRVHGEYSKAEKIPKTYKCPVCNVDFELKYDDFKLHVSGHGIENPYICTDPDCNKSFSTKHSLQRHAMKHSSDRPQFPCQVCNAIFYRNFHLTRHQQTKHRVSTNPMACTICKKKFVSEIGLNNHMNIHSDENPHTCTLCPKKFTRADHLKTHMLTAHGDNRKIKVPKALQEFKCDICDKVFKSRGNRDHHKVTHTDEKRFCCHICGKTFNHPSILGTHRKIHDDARPYCCSLCGRTFKMSHHLRDHEATHADNVPRPHVCEICGKAFKSMKHLRSHAVVHSEIKNFSCNVCDKKFSRIDNLRQHARNVHSYPKVPRRKPSQNNAFQFEPPPPTQIVASSAVHDAKPPPPPHAEIPENEFNSLLQFVYRT